jgi:hypothetical protein
MSKSEFDEFVKRQQIEQQAAATAKQQLGEWHRYLGALYEKIESYLQTYVANETARIEYVNLALNEEFIGSYLAQRMILKIGRSTITFTPIGTMIIGMKGRVDVQGPSGQVSLFLVSKQATSARSLVQVTFRRPGDPPHPSAEAIKEIEWVWKIGTPPPEMRFLELTQETFFDMILEVANA